MIEQCIEVSKLYPAHLEVGNSKFDKIEFTKGNRLDYYLETHKFPLENFPIARLKRNGNTWMSITPMELESHITHVLEATGDVLVGGLGMGYYITQIVAKADVRSVTVIEKDIEVIQAYKKLIESNPTAFDNSKLHIMHGDMFDLIPKLDKKFEYNYAYLDIWLDMCFDAISSDLEKLNDIGGINCTKLGFWGMEKFVYEKFKEYHHEYGPEEMLEMIQDELVDNFGSVMEWCYKPSIELFIQLDVCK